MWKRALLIAGCLAACTRDLTLPAQTMTPVSSVQGRIVVEEPGTGHRLPAQGVFVELLHSNLSARTNSDGRFNLSPLPDFDGTLSLRFDSDGDGQYERQRIVPLSELAAGATSGTLAAGELLVGENAFVRGAAVRADMQGATGQAGTTVYVPGSPYSTTTSDTGAFLLRDLPTGTIDVAAFRDGYNPQSLSGVALQSGQVLDTKGFSLPVAGSHESATLSGTVLRTDAPSQGANVLLLKSGGKPDVAGDVVSTAAVGADSTFTATGVPGGLYDAVIRASGVSDARVYNVLIVPGQQQQLTRVVLAPGQDMTSGMGAASDGGVSSNNHPPVASAASFVTAAGAVATLDGSASSDPDGDALVFDWVQTGGTPVVLQLNHSQFAQKPTFLAPSGSEKLTFDLHVTDPGGATSSSSCTVTVDLAPVAVAPHAVVGNAGSTLMLDGTGSYDPDSAGPLTFRWTAQAPADGGAPAVIMNATSATASLVLPSMSGLVFDVTLVVNDGYVDSAPAHVTAYAGAINLPPVAVAGPDQTLDFGGLGLLDPRGSYDPNGPLSGTAFKWTWVGTGCGTLMQDAQGLATIAAVQADCDADALLTVTDPTNLISTDTAHVQVRDHLPPQLSSVSPPANSSGAPAFGPVQFVFSRAITAPSDGGGITVTSADGGFAKGTTRYDATTRTLSFVPALPFEPGVMMTATASPLTTQGLTADGGFSFTFQARQPTLQPMPLVLGGSNSTLNHPVVASFGGDYWVGGRPTGFPSNESVSRWNRNVLTGEGGIGYGFTLLIDEVRPMLRVANGYVWYGSPFAVNSNGEVGATRLTPHVTDANADKVLLNWTSAPACPGNIGCGSANYYYGAATVDGVASMLSATIMDAGSTVGRSIRLWRNVTASAYPPSASVPGTDWSEALPQVLPAPSTAPLTWLAIAANVDNTALVWVDETNGSARKLHGAVYNWSSNAWTALPGEMVTGEINATGNALRPSIEYQHGDLIVAYYDVSAMPDVRVKRLRAGSSTWETLGGALSPTAPDLERIELATLGDTIWVGWATPPGTTARIPHVMWWNPRDSTWNAALNTGTAGQLPLAAGCASSRPGLGPTADGAGMAVVYSPVCSTVSQNGLLLQEIR